MPEHASLGRGHRFPRERPSTDRGAATAGVADARPVADAVAALRWGRPDGNWETLVEDARRVPAPAGPAGPRAFTSPPAVIDRVDALLLYDAVALLRTAALLAPAQLLLGHLLRDAASLGAQLDRVPAGDDVSRRALVVALGLLGAPPASEAAVPDVRSVPDAAAYLLAVTLADAGGGAALGAARAVTDAALLRLGAGRLLSVVE